MSGNCATGSVLTVSRPARIIITASTIAKIGRRIKKRENIMELIDGYRLYFHFRAHFKKGFGDIPVAGLDTGGNHTHLITLDQFACFYRCVNHAVGVIHHIEECSQLVGGEGRIFHNHRFRIG